MDYKEKGNEMLKLRGIKELKRDLRFAVRNRALNSYGVSSLKELNKKQLYNVLNWIYKEWQGFYTTAKGRERFKEIFKETFRREIKTAKEGLNEKDED